MKKYFLIVISALLLLSCKEKQRDFSGVYNAKFEGQYTYNDTIRSYKESFQLLISKKDDTKYSLSSFLEVVDIRDGIDYSYSISSENTIVNLSSEDKIKGDFYMLTQDGPWRKGSFEASIKGDKLQGSFDGFEAIYQRTDTGWQTIFCPITNGKFTATKD